MKKVLLDTAVGALQWADNMPVNSTFIYNPYKERGGAIDTPSINLFRTALQRLLVPLVLVQGLEQELQLLG